MVRWDSVKRFRRGTDYVLGVVCIITIEKELKLRIEARVTHYEF